ncbi:4'-phosphopantetheinyl transferase superfamily protein [Pseudonocardia sp.]|uniref:4'-phosphopantetheinyl transferase family protein n=1 Tax=Pseudonocardia sp. TaxID=60912 RepID=UPI0031FC41A0
MSECDVWWARPIDPEGAAALVSLLDDHESARLRAFRKAIDRGRYLAAHALARIVLGEHVGADPAALTLDRTCRCGKPHGKPHLAGGGPEFSLTHSGERVGVAVSADGPVGLDVEQLRPLPDLDGLAGHALSPAELRAHPPADPAAFLTTWTRKEALLKATGEGLSSPMSSITLSPADGPAAVREWTGGDAPDGPFWLVDLLPDPEHPGALAGFGAAAPRIRMHDGDALLRGLIVAGP